MTRRGTAGIALPPWITGEQYAALRRVVTLLDTMRVPYRVTGGLAGNLHGSSWPLHDIDVDVPSEALASLGARMREWPGAEVAGPARFRDEEFDLDLLELTLDSVEVDLSGAADMRLFTPAGAPHAWSVNLDAAVTRTLGALQLRVLPLEELLGYKRIIGRVADTADLARLR